MTSAPQSGRARRIIGLCILIAPGLFLLVIDLLRRPHRIVRLDRMHMLGYGLTTLIIALFWAALIAGFAMKRSPFRHLSAALFVILFGLSTGVQHAFFYRFNVYASFDTAFYSNSFPLVLFASFPRGVAGTLIDVGIAAIFALFFLALADRFLRVKRQMLGPITAGSALLLLVVFAMPVSYRVTLQSSAPSAIYLHSLTSYLGERLRSARTPQNPTLVRVSLRSPAPLPPLSAAPAKARNVLFILQESQRADIYCNEPKADCSLPTKATSALLPDRYPFLQMRAAASSTAVAISNVWAGVDPLASFEEVHSAPLVWEPAIAAGLDTAYFTSQNLMFGNARLYVQDVPFGHFVTGSDLDPLADTLVGASDDLLSSYVIEHWNDLKEPYFAVVHYSNLHRPRRIDPDNAPYQPSADVNGHSISGHNYYKNAVLISDRAVARLLRHVRSTESGRRTVIVYTSDHGESLAEHDNEIEHSSTLYDEEIRVPTFLDAPPELLSTEERESLVSKKDVPLVQYDIAATLLDLIGVWDAPAMAPFRAKIIGVPLTRKELPEGPIPLTNVSWVWEYRLPNWGLIEGNKKLFALSGDDHYRCYDLLADPLESHDLGEEGCPDLARAAREKFRILPKEMPAHIRSRPDIWSPER